jgi:hypothetical protein
MRFNTTTNRGDSECLSHKNKKNDSLTIAGISQIRMFGYLKASTTNLIDASTLCCQNCTMNYGLGLKQIRLVWFGIFPVPVWKKKFFSFRKILIFDFRFGYGSLLKYFFSVGFRFSV